MTLPPPYSPLGIEPSKVAYSSGWSSVCTARWLTDVRLRQVLRHRPRHQHAVALEPEVVVQPAGVVLLDDEGVVVARGRRRLRHRFWRLARVAHAAVGRQLVGQRRVGRRARSSRSPSRSTRSSTSSKRRCRRSGSSISSHVRGAATVGSSAAAHRVRRDRRLGRAVLAPVEEHLAGAQALGHRRGDLLGHRLLELLRDALGQHRRAARADRIGQRHVEVQTLAAAGQRDRSSARCR